MVVRAGGVDAVAGRGVAVAPGGRVDIDRGADRLGEVVQRDLPPSRFDPSRVDVDRAQSNGLISCLYRVVRMCTRFGVGRSCKADDRAPVAAVAQMAAMGLWKPD